MTDTIQVPWAEPLQGLPLTQPTHDSWTQVAIGDLDALLADHAHCEQKAASMALSLIARYPENTERTKKLMALAAEEMHHFKQVLEKIEARGRVLTKPLPDAYVKQLREWSFRHVGGVGTKTDTFLACGFVEARSCERFRLLAQALLGQPEQELQKLGAFYRNLADAESRHWESFRDFALEEQTAARVQKRMTDMAEAEAAIIRDLPIEPRMH